MTVTATSQKTNNTITVSDGTQIYYKDRDLLAFIKG